MTSAWLGPRRIVTSFKHSDARHHEVQNVPDALYDEHDTEQSASYRLLAKDAVAKQEVSREALKSKCIGSGPSADDLVTSGQDVMV